VANPRGWDMTSAEIAEALDVSWQTINRVCQLKGWLTRIRKVALRAEEGFGPVIIGGNGFSSESESAALAHYASLAEASE
ncbi:hypothetical protein, partial [Thauera sp.]|uniref:hypothetical protein n=1 Tax=Thauera sp. TaxID=1905334 RepID=UPI002C5AF4A1